MNTKNFPRPYDFFHSGNQACLIMELIPCDSLHAHLGMLVQTLKLTKEPPKWIIRSFFNLTETMLKVLKQLHMEHGVLHRDIKPDNILLDSNQCVTLIDFGMSIVMDEESSDAEIEKLFRRVEKFGTGEYGSIR